MTLLKAIRLLEASIEERRGSLREFLGEVDRVVDELAQRLRQGDTVTVHKRIYEVAERTWDDGTPCKVLLVDSGVLGRRHPALKVTYASLDDNFEFAENISLLLTAFADSVKDHADDFQEAADSLRGV